VVDGEAAFAQDIIELVIGDNDVVLPVTGDPLTEQGMFIPSGNQVSISMAAGAGGYGKTTSASGGEGGKADFEFTVVNSFYLRSISGKEGEYSGRFNVGAGGGGRGGQGGGASAVSISLDGAEWTPVAVVGGGGGGGNDPVVGGGVFPVSSKAEARSLQIMPIGVRYMKEFKRDAVA
jgi:hypothetical protein